MCNVKFKLLNKVIQGPLQYAPELSLNTELILFEICCSLLANVFPQTQNALSFLLHPGITLNPQWPWCLACKWSLSQSLQAVGNISFWCPKYIGKFVLTPSITLLLILTVLSSCRTEIISSLPGLTCLPKWSEHQTFAELLCECTKNSWT